MQKQYLKRSINITDILLAIPIDKQNMHVYTTHHPIGVVATLGMLKCFLLAPALMDVALS